MGNQSSAVIDTMVESVKNRLKDEVDAELEQEAVDIVEEKQQILENMVSEEKAYGVKSSYIETVGEISVLV